MIRALARIAHRGAVSGDEETRTPDFLLAKEALYQLSYVPGDAGGSLDRTVHPHAVPAQIVGRVGVRRLELRTSALSGQCSNQLS